MRSEKKRIILSSRVTLTKQSFTRYDAIFFQCLDHKCTGVLNIEGKWKILRNLAKKMHVWLQGQCPVVSLENWEGTRKEKLGICQSDWKAHIKEAPVKAYLKVAQMSFYEKEKLCIR